MAEADGTVITASRNLGNGQKLAEAFRKKGLDVHAMQVDQAERFVENYCRKVPLRRMANHDDIKGLVVLLASEAGAYINGENILMDGGLYA